MAAMLEVARARAGRGFPEITAKRVTLAMPQQTRKRGPEATARSGALTVAPSAMSLDRARARDVAMAIQAITVRPRQPALHPRTSPRQPAPTASSIASTTAPSAASLDRARAQNVTRDMEARTVRQAALALPRQKNPRRPGTTVNTTALTVASSVERQVRVSVHVQAGILEITARRRTLAPLPRTSPRRTERTVNTTASTVAPSVERQVRVSVHVQAGSKATTARTGKFAPTPRTQPRQPAPTASFTASTAALSAASLNRAREQDVTRAMKAITARRARRALHPRMRPRRPGATALSTASMAAPSPAQLDRARAQDVTPAMKVITARRLKPAQHPQTRPRMVLTAPSIALLAALSVEAPGRANARARLGSKARDANVEVTRIARL